jgi:hypothetical protein
LITAVNETCITVGIAGRLRTITVPLRWVFTDKKPEIGQTVEFYSALGFNTPPLAAGRLILVI